MKYKKIISISLLTLLVVFSLNYLAYGNSAEPPSILIIAPNASDDLSKRQSPFLYCPCRLALNILIHSDALCRVSFQNFIIIKNTSLLYECTGFNQCIFT